MSVLDAARDYRRRGWRVVPVAAGEKRPTCRGWPALDIRLDEIPQRFAEGGNVAAILGARSGGLVDVDLDCAEALALAGVYLPATEAVFGRPSRPRSHRLYIAPGAAHEVFADPCGGETLVELRADGRDGGGHLTLLPPSVAGGERREWAGEVIAPAGIDPRVLRRRVVWLAIGCLVRRYVSQRASETPAPDLPRLLWECDRDLGRAAYRWLGEPAPDEPHHGFRTRPRRELPQRDLDLAEIVAAIPNGCDWAEWNRIGMAIFTASGGSDEGGVIFDEFSSRSVKYDPYVTAERWRNYRRSPPSRIGLGTLIHLARQAGWRPARESA